MEFYEHFGQPDIVVSLFIFSKRPKIGQARDTKQLDFLRRIYDTGR